MGKWLHAVEEGRYIEFFADSTFETREGKGTYKIPRAGQVILKLGQEKFLLTRVDTMDGTLVYVDPEEEFHVSLLYSERAQNWKALDDPFYKGVIGDWNATVTTTHIEEEPRTFKSQELVSVADWNGIEAIRVESLHEDPAENTVTYTLPTPNPQQFISVHCYLREGAEHFLYVMEQVEGDRAHFRLLFAPEWYGFSGTSILRDADTIEVSSEMLDGDGGVIKLEAVQRRAE